jgi:predicted HAD superfamily Cof-like phosphohydrolase
MTNFQKVAAFHNAFGLPLGLSFSPNTLADFELRETLLAEETDELFEATSLIVSHLALGQQPAQSLKEDFVKELVDVLYVVYGTAASFGIDIDTAFDRVHASNMSKLVDGKPLKRADGKVLKGPNYAAPNLMDLVT